MIYGGFAKVYDIFMDNTPYDKWTDFVEKIWARLKTKPQLVLDLACGTGNMTIRLTARGYDLIGIDNSEEMLHAAKSKNNDILYLQQDMRSFELYGTVDSILCLCDSLNYILESEEMLQIFKLVKNYLNPGGSFIFDINTEYKYEHILADNNFSQTRENSAYIWENSYYPKEKINEYKTDFFISNDGKNYNRYTETHYQRAYPVDEITELIKKSGLSLYGVYGNHRFQKPQENSERIYFIVQKI